jgi:hypothetical protein
MYHLVFIAVLIKKFAMEELAQYEGRAVAQNAQRPWVEASAM